MPFLIYFYFYPSTLGCLIIEFHGFIQFAYERGYPGIVTGSKILFLDLGGFGSSFFNLFLIIFFS